MPKQVFDVSSFMQQVQGAEFMGLDDQGQATYKDQSGNVGPLDEAALKRHLAQNGANPAEIEFEYNTPGQAIPYSPVSAEDRKNMSFGNNAGNTEFLKKKFDEVYTDVDKGLLVRDKGVWKQVDPSFFGEADPWEVTKALVGGAAKTLALPAKVKAASDKYESTGSMVEALKATLPIEEFKTVVKQGKKAIEGAFRSLNREGALGEFGKDLVEAGPDIIKTAATATGAALGGVPGAGVGGLAGGRIVTSLGRALGTYQATGLEEVGDNLLDAMFSMAGQAIMPGAKPTVESFDKTISTISKEGTDKAKDMLAATLGVTKQADPNAFRQMLHHADDFIAARKDIVKEAGGRGYADVARIANQRQFNSAEELAAIARQKLSSNFGEALDTLAAKAKEKGTAGVKIDMAEALSPALSSIKDLGIGRFVKDKAGKIAFKFYDDAALEALEKQGVSNARVVDEALKPHMAKMINKVLSRAQYGEMTADKASSVFRKIESELGEIARTRISDGPVDALEAQVLSVKKPFMEGLGKAYEKLGLAAEHTALMDGYAKNAAAVNWATKKVAQENGPMQLAKALIDETGKKARSEGFAKQLVELTGPVGERLMGNIKNSYAVEQLAPIFKGNLISTVGAAGAVGFSTLGPSVAGLPATVLVGSQLLSPRLQATEVLVSRRILKTLAAIPVATKRQIMRNDDLFEAMMRPLIQSGLQEKELTNQIMGSIAGEGNRRD